MFTLTADLKGKIDGIAFTLELHVFGGPLSLQFKLDDPIPLLKVYNWGSQELHKLIGVGLPDLTHGPWSKIIDVGSPPVGLIPSVWLAPGSSTDAFHMELELTPPIQIGGTANYGGLEITVEPNFKILALYLIYNKQAGGLDFKAKVEIPNQVSKAKAALGAAAASTRTQMVSYPFPVPPQSSKSSFQLHYFGLGQRIGPDPVTGVTDPIETIFSQIENSFKTNDPAEILTALAKDFYKPDRDWFIGAHLTLRNWDLKVIFNDPDMYGVRIAAPLNSPHTFFSGFLFEILYEKLGPNLGVYFGALTLPDTLRRIDIDGVILILPGFSIWIYTNGDFRVNVGWPLGQSSIGIQLAVLTGKAGFYFAKLRSSDNPGYKPGKDADFDPILKFGIALGVYAGVSINAGIFSASLNASLTTSLQGLLAWKGREVQGKSVGSSITNPPDHYWFAGTADLVILIQGSVDFVVIKASVMIKLDASTDIALETGCKTLIQVDAGVEAEASIKIIFFTIHFHFSVHVSHTFIIGSGDLTASVNGPVNMPGGTGETGSPTLIAAQRALRQLIDRQVQSLSRLNRRRALQDQRLFDTANTSPSLLLELYFVLQPAVDYHASPESIQAVASLIIEAPTPKTSALYSAASPQKQTQYELLVRLLVGWLLDRYSDHSQTWSMRIQQVSAALGEGNEPPGPRFGGIAGFAAALLAFLQTETGISINSINAADHSLLESCAVIPMFPQFELVYQNGQGQEISVFFDAFDQYGLPGANYPAAVNAYYQALALAQLGSAGQEDVSELFGAASNPGMAGFVFVDFFLMLVRHAVRDLYQIAQQQEAQAQEQFVENVFRTDRHVKKSPDDWAQLMSVVADHAEALTGFAAYQSIMDSLNYASLAGVTSRFMLHGLRLPRPDQVPANPTPQNMRDVPTEAVYVLTGQQFGIDAGQTLVQAALQLNPFASVPPGWISFDGGTSAQCRLDVPAAPPPAPAPGWQGALMSFYNPGTVHVEALPPVSPHPLNFALKNSIGWTDETAAKTIFPLPLEILQYGVTTGCQLLLSSLNPALPQGNAVNTAPSGAPGLLIRFRLERVPLYSATDLAAASPPAGAAASPPAKGVSYLPYLYQVSPTDDYTRDLVYAALQGQLQGSSLHLMYTDPDSGTLLSEPLADTVFIARTDLSTESRAAEVHPYFELTFQQLAAQNTVNNYASLQDVPDFLWLFWECCVVNGGGYYLYYQTASGQGIPDEVFQGANSIEFDMLLLFSALANSPPASGQQIPLPGAANVLVTDAWKSATPLFARVMDIQGQPLVNFQPTYPAGTIGFKMNWKHETVASPPASIPVESLYQLFQYALQENSDYANSVWSLPLGPTNSRRSAPAGSPANPAEPWEYSGVFPLTRFLKGSSPRSGNRYEVIHKTAEIDFRMIDVYGNALPNTGNYHFTPEYNDPLIAVSEWPGINLAYQFVPESAAAATLQVILRFDPAAIAPAAPAASPASPSGFTPGADRSLIASALNRYRLIYDQITDPNVTVRIESSLMSPQTETAMVFTLENQLAAFIESVLESLQDMQDGFPVLTPTTVLSSSIPFADIVAIDENIIPLTVNLRLLREVGQSPAEQVEKLPAIAGVVSEVPANYQLGGDPPAGLAAPASPSGNNSTSLAVFAENFEAAFQDFDGSYGRLKLLQGQSDKDGFADQHRSALWALRLSPVNGINFSISPDFVYLSIRPLSNRLITRVVDDVTYTDIDLDSWASSFLRFFDTLFDPAAAAGLVIYDMLQHTGYYDSLTRFRKTLAGSIPSGIIVLFSDQQGAGDVALAKRQLTQVLLKKLASAYTISTIVQAPAEVHNSQTYSPVGAAFTPQFQGAVNVPRKSASPPQSPAGNGESRQYTFSNPKLAAASGEQWLNFFVSVKDPSAQTFLELPLQYRISYLQAGFEPDKQHQEFIPSSWLKFVLTDDPALQPMMTAAAPARIPVPLRVDPLPPTLVQQSGKGLALSGYTSPPDIAADIRDALRWEYRSRIAHRWSHQDELYLTTSYNQSLTDIAAAEADPLAGLFTALAKFGKSAASNPGWLDVLTKLAVADDPATVDLSTLTPLLAEFQTLAGDVAGAWPLFDGQTAEIQTSPPQNLTVHCFKVTYDLNDVHSITLYGKWQQGIDLLWPEISDAGGQQATAGPVMPGGSPPGGASPNTGWEQRRYTFQNVPDLSELDFRWTPLNILDVQTANTSSYVVRNSNLVPGEPTNPLFVYETPVVSYTNPLIPLIEHDQLAPLPPAATLSDSLKAILAPLLNVGSVLDASLRLEIGYSYSIAAAGSGDLRATAKILLADHIDISTGGLRGIPGELAAEIANWYQQKHPSTRGGQLDLQLFLFAKIHGNELPLVILKKVPLTVGNHAGWWQ